MGGVLEAAAAHHRIHQRDDRRIAQALEQDLLTEPGTLAFRKGLRYPPIVALVNAVVRGRSLEDATHVADLVAARVLKADAGHTFTVLGPAPAPLTKLRGEHRAQLFLKGSHRATCAGRYGTRSRRCRRCVVESLSTSIR